jgi:hypothetical protein
MAAKTFSETVGSIHEVRTMLAIGLAELARGEFDGTTVEELIAGRRADWAKRARRGTENSRTSPTKAITRLIKPTTVRPPTS